MFSDGFFAQLFLASNEFSDWWSKLYGWHKTLFILAVGIAIMVGYFLHSLFAGEKADANQWGGVTLEWKSPSPPPLENFDHDPVWTGEVYDYSTLSAEEMKR